MVSCVMSVGLKVCMQKIMEQNMAGSGLELCIPHAGLAQPQGLSCQGV